jgi:hypothetical protein
LPKRIELNLQPARVQHRLHSGMKTFQFVPLFSASGACVDVEPAGLGLRLDKFAIEPGSEDFSGSFTVIHKKAPSLV